MALEATGAAGHPEEWPENLLSGSRIDSATIRRDLWSRQSTPNGLLGVKFSYYEPTIQSFLQTFGPDAGSRG